MGQEGGDGGDPLGGWTLDDEFVRRARRREATADERLEQLRRIDAAYRRLVDERRAQLLAPEAPARPTADRSTPRRAARLVGLLFVVAVGVGLAWVVTSEGGDGGSPLAAGRTPGGEQTDAAGAAGEAASGGHEDDAGDAGGPGDPDDAVGGLLDGVGSAGGTATGPGDGDVPLGSPAPVPVASDAYVFAKMRPDGKGPVAYDPCRQIHVVVNRRTAPTSADTLLTEALAEVSRATGLRFVIDGPSSAPPTDAPPPGPGADGEWDPVLVAWSEPAESPALQGDVAGTGGSSWVEMPTGAAVYVTGQVALDGPQLAGMLELPSGHETVRAVIQHELGHLVGLDHIDDPTQLMQPVGRPGVVSFAGGDLTGLAQLGRGECFPDL